MSEESENRQRKAPSHNLAEALNFLGDVERNLGRGPFSRASIAAALGHSSESGPFSRKAGAMLHFDLLERTGTNYRISKTGQSILRPTDDKERAATLATAAQSPTLYAELIHRFANQALPNLLPNILIREFGVHPNSAEEVALNFRDTMEFAGLLQHGILHTAPVQNAEASNGDSTPSNPQQPVRAMPSPGDAVQWTSQGISRFAEPQRVTRLSPDGKFVFVNGSATGIPIEQVEVVVRANDTAKLAEPIATADHPAAVSSSAPALSKNDRREVFAVHSGHVTVQWPATLTADDITDIEDWLPILLRKMKRSASAESVEVRGRESD
jgi:hypothetical protein